PTRLEGHRRTPRAVSLKTRCIPGSSTRSEVCFCPSDEFFLLWILVLAHIEACVGCTAEPKLINSGGWRMEVPAETHPERVRCHRSNLERSAEGRAVGVVGKTRIAT